MTKKDFQNLHELTDSEMEWLAIALKNPDVKIVLIHKNTPSADISVREVASCGS